MKLSILVPSLSTRNNRRLLNKLHEQAHNASRLQKEVEVLEHRDNGYLSSGTKRNQLMDHANGDYVAFVDDDDDVADNYVTKLLHGCYNDPDVVTFALARRWNDKLETWFLCETTEQQVEGRRLINHLCAWKRHIAAKVRWCDQLGYADDQLWFKPLIHALPYIEAYNYGDVLYHYNFSFQVSQNHKSAKTTFARNYFKHGLRCFKPADPKAVEQIYIEVHKDPVPSSDTVYVRDSVNREHLMYLSDLNHFYTCKVR